MTAGPARLWALAAAGLVWLACQAEAPARPAPPRKDPAVTQLEAVYAPIAQIAAGPNRTRRACADRDKLTAAVTALPKPVPTGAAVDGDTWHASVGSLGLALSNLVAACQSPDLKVHHISGEVETADDCLSQVDTELQGVLDQARPRDLLPAMKRAQTALKSLLSEPGSKQLCARRDALAKLVAGLVEPPPHTSTQKWEQAHALVTRNLDQIKTNRCHGPRGAEVELADAMTQVHDGFYQLVLQLPPRAD